MALTPDTSCLYSTCRNTSGVAKIFGFLPPHGKQLAAGEEMTVFGDIRQAIIRFERTESRRNIIAFEAAIQRKDLLIVNTPNPILEDEATETTKMLRLNSGTLGVIDPCWQESVSGPPLG